MNGPPPRGRPSCSGCTISRFTAPSSASVAQSALRPVSLNFACARMVGARMPVWRATALPEAIITWFCAITVTVAPEIASMPMTPSSGRDWPTSSLSPTNLPRYWSLNLLSALSGMPSSRIGSECLSTLTPTKRPWVSMPISVTTGLPE